MKKTLLIGLAFILALGILGCAQGKVQFNIQQKGNKYFLYARMGSDSNAFKHFSEIDSEDIVFNLPQKLIDDNKLKFKNGVFVIDTKNNAYPIASEENQISMSSAVIQAKNFELKGVLPANIKAIIFVGRRTESETKTVGQIGDLKFRNTENYDVFSIYYIPAVATPKSATEWNLIPGEKKSERLSYRFSSYGDLLIDTSTPKDMLYYINKFEQK